VRMRGFSAREQSDAVSSSPAEAEAVPVPASIGDLLLAPVWDAEAAPSSSVVPGPSERVVVVGGTAEQMAALRRLCPQAVAMDGVELSAAGAIEHVVWILPEGAGIGLVFFGFYALLTGYLVIRSTFLPRILGVLGILGGVGWISFLYPPLGYRLFSVIGALGLLGAGAKILWLIVFGVNEQRWKEQASAEREAQ